MRDLVFEVSIVGGDDGAQGVQAVEHVYKTLVKSIFA